MTLIKDLIRIPERVLKGDFVLRLTEGVNRAEETLRDYVVTSGLTVVTIDSAVDTVKLDHALLCQQFSLKKS